MICSNMGNYTNMDDCALLGFITWISDTFLYRFVMIQCCFLFYKKFIVIGVIISR